MKEIHAIKIPSFFLVIQSKGSAVPSRYNQTFLGLKRYGVVTQDTFTGSLWQKESRNFISNKDEELLLRFKDRYKFL
jgi:hypothetical protein